MDWLNSVRPALDSVVAVLITSSRDIVRPFSTYKMNSPRTHSRPSPGKNLARS
nr:MAG TPA: hypothetical protein [Caudoviricetes sp.]